MDLLGYLTSFIYSNDYIPESPLEVPELKTFPNIITNPSFKIEIIDGSFIIPKLNNSKLLKSKGNHSILLNDIRKFDKSKLKFVITESPNCFKLMYIQEQINRIKEQRNKRYYSPTLRYFKNREKRDKKKKRSCEHRSIDQPRDQGFKIFRKLHMFM